MNMSDNIAAYFNQFLMTDQHPSDRSMTRGRHDIAKMTENNEISSGPGRWALGVPNAYGNAAFIPTPTTINQRWGASHCMTSTKTDTESDLRNLGRLSVRTVAGQYHPDQGRMMAEDLVSMPEVDFPQSATHLFDPPATLRGTGINRWEWLHSNPQENVDNPFVYRVNTQQVNKDAFRLSQIRVPEGIDLGVPVARAKQPGDPSSFVNSISGVSQKPVMSS